MANNKELAIELDVLKKQIDELKIRRISDLRDKEKLETEIKVLETEIKDSYGVEVKDFENAMTEMKKMIETKMEALKKKLQDAKEKIKE